MALLSYGTDLVLVNLPVGRAVFDLVETFTQVPLYVCRAHARLHRIWDEFARFWHHDAGWL